MRRKAAFIFLFSLTACLVAAEPGELFGTYNNGNDKVTMGDIQNYKETFQQITPTMSRLVYPVEDHRETELFRRIVSEAGMAKNSKTSPFTSPTLVAKQRQELIDQFVNQRMFRELSEEAKNYREKDLAGFFEETKTEYKNPDRIKIRMIFKEFGLEPSPEKKEQVKKDAEALLEIVRENPDQFGEIARRHSDSQTAEKGGEVDWLQRGMKGLNPEFFDLVFGMDVMEISDLVDLPTGFAIIRLEKKETAHVPRLDDVRKRVETRFIHRQYTKLGETVQGNKQEFNARKKKILEIPENRKSLEYLENAFLARKYIEERIMAIKFEDKDFRRFHRQKRKFLYLPMKWEVAAICIKPDPEDVKKDQIHKHYAMEEAEKRAGVIMERLNQGEDFSDLAVEYSGDPSSTEGGYFGWVSRRTNSLFASRLEDKVVGDLVGPIGYGNAWWILRVLRTREKKLPSMEETRKTVGAWLKRSVNQRMRIAFYQEQYRNSSPEILHTAEPDQE